MLRIVGIVATPVPVEEAELAAVRSVVNCGRMPARYGFLPAGSYVRVTRGPLCGTEGILVTSGDSRKLVVSISLLMRSVAVELGADDIEPASRAPAVVLTT